MSHTFPPLLVPWCLLLANVSHFSMVPCQKQFQSVKLLQISCIPCHKSGPKSGTVVNNSSSVASKYETVVKSSRFQKCGTVVKSRCVQKCGTVITSGRVQSDECYTLLLYWALYLPRSLEREINFKASIHSTSREASDETLSFGHGISISVDSVTLLTTFLSWSTLEQSTSLRIVYLKVTEHHSGAFSRVTNVDLNKDCVSQPHRTPLWCIFLSWGCRPQQGLCTSTSQNTTLVPFLAKWTSPSTGIMHLNLTEHHSGAFSCHDKVDLNRDCAPQLHRTPLWCICRQPLASF